MLRSRNLFSGGGFLFFASAPTEDEMEIKEHMEVIGADGVHVGTVDKVEGGRIKLTKKDAGEGSHKRPSSLHRKRPRCRR
jgi:uncharacterized protein DUF2171